MVGGELDWIDTMLHPNVLFMFQSSSKGMVEGPSASPT